MAKPFESIRFIVGAVVLAIFMAVAAPASAQQQSGAQANSNHAMPIPDSTSSEITATACMSRLLSPPPQ